jgi:cell shape-determining protein MreD
MNPFQTILILAFAFLAVFGEATLSFPRDLLGAQVNLLPALMVYAALNTGLPTVCLLAVFGGIWTDTFSANPLGVSILPLIIVGFPLSLRRDLILRDLPFAQFVLGAVAGAVVPAVTLLMILSGSVEPVLGWGTLWQWIVMTVGSAVATPFIFELMNWCNRALGYLPHTEISFRPDREIQRDRNLK